MRDWPCDDFNIRDLLVIVRNARPDSALGRELHPDTQPHFLAQHQLYLARSMDMTLRWLQWSKTKDGSKGRNMPEPYPFPWEDTTPPGTMRGDSMTVDEAADFLGWELHAV